MVPCAGVDSTSGPQMLRTLLQSALSERLNVAAFVEFTVDDIHTSESPVSARMQTGPFEISKGGKFLNVGEFYTI